MDEDETRYARFQALTSFEASGRVYWRHVSRLLDALGFVVGPEIHDGFLWFFYRGDRRYPLPISTVPFTEATFEWNDVSVRVLLLHCYNVIDRYGVEQPEAAEAALPAEVW